jgi:diguanylate cyclase (GGDEF)-like protein/PAS domain S-box-containing protein
MLATGVGIETSEFRVSRPDNGIGWLRLRTAPIRSAEGNVTGFSGTLADFTAARLGIERRLQRETQLRAITASAPIVLFSVDLDGIVTFVESGPNHFLGYDPSSNVGKHVRDAGATDEMEAALARTFRGEHANVQVKHGNNHLDVNLVPMVADDGSVIGALGVAVDVTELVETRDALAAYSRELELLLEKLSNSERDLQAKSQLLEQALAEEQDAARRDSLTGALNHGAVSALLQALNADIGRPCAVLMVDLDNLKAINSTFSHEAGDLILQEACKVLQEEGAIVGRYGGDEFIAILPDADGEAASEYRRRVLARFEELRVVDPLTRNRVPLSAAIGIAAYPRDAESVMDAVRVADVAVVDAKRSKPPPALSGLIVEPSLDDERAARIVGELVPLLTRTGRMQDKLRLAAHRLAIAAGYDVVTIEVLDPTSRSDSIIESFARVSRSVIEAWKGKLRQLGTSPLFELLRSTHRPVIIDRVIDDERMPEGFRRLVLDAGINSTLTVPMLWEDQVMGTISVGSVRQEAFSPRDAHFLTSVAAQVTAIVRMAHMVDELQKASVLMADMRGETVMLLARAAEAHSDAAGGVLENVRAVTEALARELGESAASAGELGLAAALHDIGKIRIPSTILSKADELSTEDWGLLRMHTIWGQEFFEGRAGFELAATIARSHHERWDGSGYPDGLKGDQIPVPATIVTVADSLDAMINNRPYRQGRSLEEAIQELKRCSGSQFNPDVIRALLRLQRQGQLPLIVTNRGLAA